MGISWKSIDNIHYIKLYFPQDPRTHGKSKTENEAAHDNFGYLIIWIKYGKWLKYILLDNRKFHSTRTTDRCVRALLNKRNTIIPHSIKEIQYKIFNIKIVVDIFFFNIICLFNSKFLLNMKYSFNIFFQCTIFTNYFNNILLNSEVDSRLLIIGRKRVSAYDLWQYPSYRL